MSSERTAALTAGYKAFAEGGLAAGIAAMPFDPEIEWRPLDGEGDVGHGHAGVVRQMERWLDSWEGYWIQPEEFIERGDEVIVLVREGAEEAPAASRPSAVTPTSGPFTKTGSSASTRCRPSRPSIRTGSRPDSGMSQQNGEIVRSAIDQWQRGGRTLEAIPVEFLAEDGVGSVCLPLVDFPDRGVGRNNFLDAMATYFSSFTNYQAEATEFIDAGENVITVVHEKAGMGDSDMFVERDLAQVWTLRDGRLVKVPNVSNETGGPRSRWA